MSLPLKTLCFGYARCQLLLASRYCMECGTCSDRETSCWKSIVVENIGHMNVVVGNWRLLKIATVFYIVYCV